MVDHMRTDEVPEFLGADSTTAHKKPATKEGGGQP
jgi:hypothetical protein